MSPPAENVNIGSYAVFEPLPSMPNPGLLVQGRGIGMPLSDTDAALIRAVGHDGCGGNVESALDQDVQGVWELSRNEFSLANPEWHKEIDEILGKVSTRMGISASGKSLQAEPYKMRLQYRTDVTGGDCARNFPGKFGTMAIGLPSKHEGADILFESGARFKLFDASIHTEFGYYYSAWLSGVLNKEDRVESGRQLVLYYDLIQTSVGSVGMVATNSKKPLSMWLDELDDLAHEIFDKPRSAYRERKKVAEIYGEAIARIRLRKSQTPPDTLLEQDALWSTRFNVILAHLFRAAVFLEDEAASLGIFDLFLICGKIPVYLFEDIGVVVRTYALIELLPRSRAIILFHRFAVTPISPYYSTLQTWVMEQALECAKSTSLDSVQDGIALSQLCRIFPEIIFETVSPAIKQNVQSTALVTAFFLELLDNPDRISNLAAETLFRNVISDVAEHFSIDKRGESIMTNKLSRVSDGSRRPVSESLNRLKERDLALLLYYCHSLEFFSELDQIILEICEGAANVDVLFWDSVLLPFLKDMADVLRERKVVIARSPFRSLFQSVLCIYLETVVSVEPGTSNLSMKATGCKALRCKICASLDRFLRCHSTESRVEYGLSQNQVQHLCQHIDHRSCTIENDEQKKIFRVTKLPIDDGPHDAWKERAENAAKKIKGLGTDLLKELLEECHDFIVNFATIKRAPPSMTDVSDSWESVSLNPCLESDPPFWLSRFLKDLQCKFPCDSFEVAMVVTLRCNTIDLHSDTLVRVSLSAPCPVPNANWVYFPYIRCHDCPGKLFPPRTNDLNFADHLKDLGHRSRVGARLEQALHARGSRGHTPPAPKIDEKWADGAPNCLTGISFYFDGRLPTLSRSQGTQIIERYGGGVVDVFTMDIDFFVLETEEDSIKMRKLFELHEYTVKTVDEVALYNLICQRSANLASVNSSSRLPFSTLESNLMNFTQPASTSTSTKRKFTFIDSENDNYRSHSIASKAPKVNPQGNAGSSMIDMTGDSD